MIHQLMKLKKKKKKKKMRHENPLRKKSKETK